MFLDGVESRLELLETVALTILKTVDKSKLSDEERFRIETFTFLTWRRFHVK